MLAKPREALAQVHGMPTALRDPRLSRAGNWLARHLRARRGSPDARVENWLRTPDERELTDRDREIFEPLLARRRRSGERGGGAGTGTRQALRTGESGHERSHATGDRAAASAAGQSLRAIAEELGISRGAVQRVHWRGCEAERDRLPARAHAATAPEHHRSVRADPEGTARPSYPNLTAERACRNCGPAASPGKYTIVQRPACVGCGRDPRRRPCCASRPAKGEQAQMDYAVYDIDFTREGRRRVNLFSYVLGYSRRQYLRFVESKDLRRRIREHVRAFEHLGGVAATCLYDNMKVVVPATTSRRADLQHPLPRLRHALRLPTVWACRSAGRKRRESANGPSTTSKTSLLNGRTFGSLEHLNEVTAKWLAEVADVRVHRETKRRPIDLHAEELPYLIPLAEACDYDTAEVVYRTVNAEGIVTYRQNFYSVPWRISGRCCRCGSPRGSDRLLGPDLEEIARHPLLPRTADRRAERIDQEPSSGGRSRASGHGYLRQRFANLGPVGQSLPRRPARKQIAGQGLRPSSCWPCSDVPQGGRACRLRAAVRFGGLLAAPPSAASSPPTPNPKRRSTNWPTNSSSTSRDPRGPAGPTASTRRLRTTSRSPGVRPAMNQPRRTPR